MPVLHVWVKVGTHFSFFFFFKGNVILVIHCLHLDESIRLCMDLINLSLELWVYLDMKQ